MVESFPRLSFCLNHGYPKIKPLVSRMYDFFNDTLNLKFKRQVPVFLVDKDQMCTCSRVSNSILPSEICDKYCINMWLYGTHSINLILWNLFGLDPCSISFEGEFTLYNFIFSKYHLFFLKLPISPFSWYLLD